MNKAIKALLKFFKALCGPESVASVLNDFHKKIDKLDSIASQNRSLAADAIEEKNRVEEEARKVAAELYAEASKHDAEANSALAVASNIRKLLNA